MLLWGCGSSSDGPSLAELEKFDAYPLYYAGEEVGGNQLETILGNGDWEESPSPRSLSFTFVYGDCDPPDGLFAEGGCAPPVQIQTYSICNRNLGMYSGRQKAFDVKGAKGSTNGGGLEVFTGRTTVVIFGGGSLKRIKSTVGKLRRVGEEVSPRRLPPPVPGGVWGKASCR